MKQTELDELCKIECEIVWLKSRYKIKATEYSTIDRMADAKLVKFMGRATKLDKIKIYKQTLENYIQLHNL